MPFPFKINHKFNKSLFEIRVVLSNNLFSSSIKVPIFKGPRLFMKEFIQEGVNEFLVKGEQIVRKFTSQIMK